MHLSAVALEAEDMGRSEGRQHHQQGQPVAGEVVGEETTLLVAGGHTVREQVWEGRT